MGLNQKRTLAWGNKVTAVFRDRVFWIGEDLEFDPNNLMAGIAWETGEKFSASVTNMAGSGATGLIQFMPATARSLGTTTAALAKMSAEDQLNYVHAYFKPFRGRLRTLADLYMAILWPNGVGKPESYVLFDRSKPGKAYRQNSGIDMNKDGLVTKAEATAKVNAKLVKGMQPGLIWRE